MKLELIHKKIEVPGVESFVFKPQEPLAWKAGQYLHYTLPHGQTDDRGDSRWFTVSSAPFEKLVMITTRLTHENGSSFKSALVKLEIGETIEASAPDGDFTVDDPAREYVFIAGGIGITPFHSILKEADHVGEKLRVTLLYGNRDEHVVFEEELEEFAKNNPNLTIHYLLAPERVDETTIRKYVTDISKPAFYISGPEPMVKALEDIVRGMGIEKENIKLDDFPGYPME